MKASNTRAKNNKDNCPPFYFSFSHYDATYYHRGRLSIDSGIRRKFSDDEAWELFYEHATFEEIFKRPFRTLLAKPRYALHRQDRGGKREFLPDNPCISSYFSEKKCEHKTCPYDERISRCQHLSDYYKKWLQAMRDNQDQFLLIKKEPWWLSEAVQILIRVLWTAKWHTDKEEREKTRELLIDNLIPHHKEHKTGLLPHYKILIPLRELLVRLATHLSKKCKADYLRGEDLNDKAVFEELLIWAKENDLRIFNIASESKKSIVKLVSKPAEYANGFLAKRYDISIRTLKDSFKNSVANIHSY